MSNLQASCGLPQFYLCCTKVLNTFNLCFPVKMIDDFWETWRTLHTHLLSSTLAPMSQITWCHVSEDHNCDNFMSCSLTSISSILNWRLTFLNISFYSHLSFRWEDNMKFNFTETENQYVDWIYLELLVRSGKCTLSLHKRQISCITLNSNLLHLLEWSTFKEFCTLSCVRSGTGIFSTIRHLNLLNTRGL
jgi:hypothetical protein